MIFGWVLEKSGAIKIHTLSGIDGREASATMVMGLGHTPKRITRTVARRRRILSRRICDALPGAAFAAMGAQHFLNGLLGRVFS